MLGHQLVWDEAVRHRHQRQAAPGHSWPDPDVERLFAVIGDFHLSGTIFEPIIDRICADLAAFDPAMVMPGHWTVWRSQHALGRVFGERHVPSCVGAPVEL